MFRVMLMGELPAIICCLCVENGVARNVQCLHMQSHRNDAYVQRHFYCMNVIQCVLISGSRQKSVEANGPKFFFFLIFQVSRIKLILYLCQVMAKTNDTDSRLSGAKVSWQKKVSSYGEMIKPDLQRLSIQLQKLKWSECTCRTHI